MKKLYVFIATALLCAVAIIVSCTKQGVEAPEPTPPILPGDWQASTLRVLTPEIQIGASNQTVFRQITVEATDTWTIASKPAWITTKDATRTGFTIEVEPWLDGETATRKGAILIEMGELDAEIAITQLTFVIPYVLSVSLEEIPGALADQTYPVEVTASHVWEVDTEEAWIMIGDVDEKGFNITVDEYGDAAGTERSGTVVVSSRDSQCEIEITQIKPNPNATPLADYLGEYTITAMRGSNMNSSLPGYFEGTIPYEETGTMKISDLGTNWVSIDVLGTNLFFTYDPVTGTLLNNNYADGNWSCTFSHFTHHQLNEWTPPSNLFFAFDQGSMTFQIDEDRKIVVPETVYVPSMSIYVGGLTIDVGGLDKKICICQFSLQHRITMSDYLTDITFTKK